MELKFRENGEFSILAIADAQDTDNPQKETTDIIRYSIEKTSPNLIILLGDNIAGDFEGVTPKRTKAAVKALLEPISEKDIPFALVFGNHDHEGLVHRCGFEEKEAKEFILEEFQKNPLCLAVKGEPVSGVCTYNLPIISSDGKKTAFNLWLMDSGTYDNNGGYGYVQADQNEWYIKKSDELKEQNGGAQVPSFLFQHIPVPEVYRLMKKYPMFVPGSVTGGSALFKGFYKGYKIGRASSGKHPAAQTHRTISLTHGKHRVIFCVRFSGTTTQTIIWAELTEQIFAPFLPQATIVTAGITVQEASPCMKTALKIMTLKFFLNLICCRIRFCQNISKGTDTRNTKTGNRGRFYKGVILRQHGACISE